MRSLGVFLLAASAALGGCRSKNGEPPNHEVAAAVQPATDQAAEKTAAAPVAAPSQEPASLGQPAPDFSLEDLDGQTVTLSSFKGKLVVLEWFNPKCPFVRASHTKGSLVGTADRQMAGGVVWLAINSGAPGKQGASSEENQEARKRFSLKHPILLDPSGKVGKLYGAKTTPHLFVVAPDGKLVYRGGIDNSPDGEGESPRDGKLVNYVDQAVAALRASQPIASADTEPYGCSVKYAN